MDEMSSGGLAIPVPLSAEIQARLRDFLSRKAFHIPGSLEALISTMSMGRIRSSLHGLLDHLRRERRHREGSDGWAALAERIHEHGRKGTIEGYAEYLFPVEFRA